MEYEKYNEAKTYYNTHSTKILRWSAGAIILILIVLLLVTIFGTDLLSGTQLFFVFMSLLSLSISVGLQLKFKGLMDDPVSELFEITDLVELETELAKVDVPSPTDEQKKILFQKQKEKAIKKKELDSKLAKYRLVFKNDVFFGAGILFLLPVIVMSLVPSCNQVGYNRKEVKAHDDGKIDIDFVQVNDVYEIAALDSGRTGGLSRVAAFKKACLKDNPNTLLVIAGDFLSPSVFNSVKESNGEPLGGRQMIETMNAAGFDIAMFGNHEFDISKEQLQQRINESNFEWVASNVHNVVSGSSKKNNTSAFQKNGTAIPACLVKTFTDSDGTVAKIGFIALTTPTKIKDSLFASFDPTLESGIKAYNEIKNSCDAVIAITHQSMEDDKKLAAAIPQLALIIGGHEHNMQFGQVGNVAITKAHSNAKSAFKIKMIVDTRTKKNTVLPELKKLDSTVAQDYLLESIAQNWTEQVYQYFTDAGFNPNNIIISKGQSLDARDDAVRKHSTNFTNLICRAIIKFCGKADLAIFNAGSIRIDDFLKPPISEFDILKALPYKGEIKEVEMTGKTLMLALDSRSNNKDDGGFLQYSENISIVNGQWLLRNKAIDATQNYRVAMNDFLLKGSEKNLNFLDPGKGYVKIIDEHHSDKIKNDIRKIVIEYLAKVSLQERLLKTLNKKIL